MQRDYLDFDLALVKEGTGYRARVVTSPAGTAETDFVMPFGAVELAQFMNAVGPPRVASRRLVPAATRVLDVKDYGTRLGSALLDGEVDRVFRESLETAKKSGSGLRVRLRLDGVPELDPIPWEYLYYPSLGRFLTLSAQTPLVRVLDSLDEPAPVTVTAPLRVLVMISSPSDVPALEVERERQLLMATTGDLVASGRLEVVVLEDATLPALQRALLEEFHVFHFIGHGGFEKGADKGVLVLERDDGTAHHVSGERLGTLLHDAKGMQLVVLNACEGARTSGRDAFSGVAQALVQQGLPAVVAMQTEISDRAALVFSHEFYYFLTRGLPIDAAMCEVRKAMATSDEASEWGTAVLLRSGSGQPFDVSSFTTVSAPAEEERLQSLYRAARNAIAVGATDTAVPLLEQLDAEKPGYSDVTQLLERVRPREEPPDDPDDREEPPDDPDGPDGTPDPDPTQPDPQTGWRATLRRLRPWIISAIVTLFVVVVALAIYGWNADPEGGPSPGPSETASLPTDTTEPTTDSTETSGDPALAACGPTADISSVDAAFVLSCTLSRPVIDGAFSDWESVPARSVTDVIARLPGANDETISADVRAVWDREALYVNASVVDPDIRDVNEARPDQFWRGDGISFEFGPDARDLGKDAGLRNGRDRHVLIGLSAGNALGAVNVAARNDFPTGGAIDDIEAKVALTDTGYHLEARIPWHVLGISAPQRGAVFAANVNISDAKPDRANWELGTMISSNPERSAQLQKRPATWQVLVLGDPT